jgi:hypothetical protein
MTQATKTIAQSGTPDPNIVLDHSSAPASVRTRPDAAAWSRAGRASEGE